MAKSPVQENSKTSALIGDNGSMPGVPAQTTPPTANGGDSQEELRELLRVFLAVRDGDFSVRLPEHWSGLHGKIADAVNDFVSANQAMAEQLEEVGQAVGK